MFGRRMPNKKNWHLVNAAVIHTHDGIGFVSGYEIGEREAYPNPTQGGALRPRLFKNPFLLSYRLPGKIMRRSLISDKLKYKLSDISVYLRGEMESSNINQQRNAVCV